MLFTLLLIAIGNGYIILTNMAMTSVTSYLSVTVFLSAIAYLLCFLIGFARVHLGDSSAFLSIVFGHPCVDVYAETKGQYLKYKHIYCSCCSCIYIVHFNYFERSGII